VDGLQIFNDFDRWRTGLFSWRLWPLASFSSFGFYWCLLERFGNRVTRHILRSLSSFYFTAFPSFD